MIAPTGFSMTPRLDDAICEKLKITETKAALKAAVAYCRAREWELSFCAGALCRKVKENPCYSEIPPKIIKIKKKKKKNFFKKKKKSTETSFIAEADTDISTIVEHENGNSHAALESSTGKSQGERMRP